MAQFSRLKAAHLKIRPSRTSRAAKGISATVLAASGGINMKSAL
jgi:hypothetical protein